MKTIKKLILRLGHRGGNLLWLSEDIMAYKIFTRQNIYWHELVNNLYLPFAHWGSQGRTRKQSFKICIYRVFQDE
jgi:hypothetical protein